MEDGASWERYCSTISGPVTPGHECLTDTYPDGSNWRKLRREFQAACDRIKRDGEKASGYAVVEITLGREDAIYRCKFGVEYVAHDRVD